MVIVTGSVTAKAECLGDVERLSLEHVERSRKEPGCLLHSVHRDVENTHRFVFLEHWTDKEALLTHFGVPASGNFVSAVADMATVGPSMEIYEAEPLVL